VNQKATSSLDQEIGRRIRGRRLALGISQERLGDLLGLTFQQVQKYEKGTNRISASRLHEIARILKVPVDSFYREERSASPEPDPLMFLATREGADLARAFGAIRSHEARRALVEYAKAAAALESTIGAAEWPETERPVRRRPAPVPPATRS
jgi:transcriptional regulator with XRE-family HTH domain